MLRLLISDGAKRSRRLSYSYVGSMRMLSMRFRAGLKSGRDVITVESVVFTSHWQVGELDSADLDNLSFCKVGEWTSGSLKDTGVPVSAKDVESIQKLGSLAGDLFRIRWLYASSINSANVLGTLFNLTEDGEIELPRDASQRFLAYVKADSLFHTLLSFSKKFIDKAEYCIDKHYGNTSTEYAEWKGIARSAYDGSIVYALMYDLRNCVEHDFWTISLVNYDPETSRAGLALNVDNGLLALSKLKGGTKERLRSWAKERAKNGDVAWLSLGKCINTYQGILEVLYAFCFSLLYEKIVETIGSCRETLSSMPGNAVLWRGETSKKYSANQQPRVYPIAGLDFEDYLLREKALIDEWLDGKRFEMETNTQEDGARE